MSGAGSASVSVIVTGAHRTEELAACLDLLSRQRRAPHEVLVVGRDAEDQQQAIQACGGDIVALIDSTSRPAPTWLDKLTAPYGDPAVAGVGGPIICGDGSAAEGRVSEIGRLLPNGSITMGFGLDPGRPVLTDHLPHGNASFRRAELRRASGLLGPRALPEHRSATLISLTLRAAGSRLVFEPAACVTAPSTEFPPGQDPFSYRDRYLHNRDLVVMLIEAFGWRSPYATRFARTMLRRQQEHVRRFVRTAAPRGAEEPGGGPASSAESWKALLWIPTDTAGVAAGFAHAARRSMPGRRQSLLQTLSRASPRSRTPGHSRRASPQAGANHRPVPRPTRRLPG
ncbi:glycosyltransferase family 2 protein [Nesterenkonia sp. NBAIMH1]|uniref:glycosyltransferase n=1 Tax=Nesterenkonia sp. NBAIMH1 TaxID=2600320 RepID=UPI0011B549D8|nr:glycosyltransferase family 2 protein [Nesterenkonia sp. NBAIMH1]